MLRIVVSCFTWEDNTIQYRCRSHFYTIYYIVFLGPVNFYLKQGLRRNKNEDLILKCFNVLREKLSILVFSFKLSYYNEYKSYLRYEMLKLREPYKSLMADVLLK